MCPAGVYPHGLNRMFGSMFCVGCRVRQETPEEDRRTNRPKRCEYYENNSPNTLNDENYQASSQTFR